MQIYYKGCLCTYGTYRVMAEDRPVFYLKESPSNVDIFELGFEEVRYGLWCHFLSKDENDKIEKLLEKSVQHNQENGQC